jgi:hypothetical protein
MLDSACKHFPNIPRNVVTLQTNQLDICDGHFVDITAEIWDDVIDLLTVVEVTRAEMKSPIPWPFLLPDNQPALSQVNNKISSYAPPFYKYFTTDVETMEQE